MVSDAFVKLTRNIHRSAIVLHMAGLRAAVQTANRKEAKAVEVAARADAVVKAAVAARADANFAAGKAHAHARYVEFAAQSEANEIGGKL